MPDPTLESFREAVIDRFNIAIDGQQRDYRQYLSLPTSEREGDEADAVDDKFARLTLEWLGFSGSDWSYNRPQAGQKSNRPDYSVKGPIGLAFVWEDKNSTLDLEAKHVQQMRRYSIGTAGYAVWCNMRRLLAVRFLSSDTLRYETLADVSVEQLYGSQAALDDFQEKQAAQLALFHLLFSKARFTQFDSLIEKIAVGEEAFQNRAADLSSPQALKTFTASSRQSLNNLRLAALARINEALNQTAQVDQEERELNREWEEAAAEFTHAVMHNQSVVRDAIGAIRVGESDVTELRRIEEVLKQALGLTKLTSSLKTYYEKWLERAERINNALYLQRFQITGVRRVADAYRVWSNRQSDDADIKPAVFAEQVAYVFFVRLLLVRVLEDKKLLSPRIASDGGFQDWIGYVKSHFAEIDGVGILNENFCSLLNRKAGRYYLHFYQQPIFDWFIPDDYLLVQTLEFLCRYSFQKVDSDIIGFTYEEYIERVARNRKGHFLTRPGVVEYMLDLLGYRGPSVIGRRLLDPACGSGSFLVHAARRYRQALVESLCRTHRLASPDLIQHDPALRRELAQSYLDALKSLFFGLELNPFGCYLAEMNLLIQAVDDLYELQQSGQHFLLDRFHVYNTDSLDLPREVLDDPHVAGEVAALSIPDRLSDRLADEAHLIKGRLQEKQEEGEGETRQDYSGGFFYLVCNPPYVSSKREKLKLDRIKDTPFFRTARSGDTNLYLLFLKLGTYYLAQSGQMVFIVPLTIFGDASSNAARNLLRTAPYSPGAAIRFYRGNDLFPGVDQAVGIVRVNHSQQNATLLLGGGIDEQAAAASQFTANVADVIDAVPRNEDWKGAWLVYNDPISLGIWNQAKSVSNGLAFRLGGLLEAAFGLEEGIRQGDVNATYLNPLRVGAAQGSYAAGHVAICKGEEVGPFTPMPTIPTDWATSTIAKGATAATAKAAEVLDSIKASRSQEKGIVVRQVARLNTRDRLYATWFDRGAARPLAFTNELWRMLLKPEKQDEDGLTLLALINSKPLVFLLNLFASNNHVGKDELARIPIPDPHTLPMARLASLAGRLLAERAALQGDYVGKYRAKLPGHDQGKVYVPPSAVLDSLSLSKLKVAMLTARGDVVNRGPVNGRVKALNLRGFIKSGVAEEEPSAEAFAQAVALFFAEPSRQGETWTQAQQWQLPDPAVAASWLQTYNAVSQEAQAAWQRFVSLQLEVDAVVADWYGFDDAMKAALARGLPWAKRRPRPSAADAEEAADGLEPLENGGNDAGGGLKGTTTRVPVNSSALYAIGYDPTEQTLEVEFFEGSIVQYQGVPLEVYQGFEAASSKGAYYAATIKDDYIGEKF